MSWEQALTAPDDPPRIAALALGLAAPWLLPAMFGARRESRWWRLAPLAALLSSAAYVAYYLRGGPRIIDATSYYLEAHTLASGRLSLPLPDVQHAVLGRFLVRSAEGGASVIFPPGYPAVLALGAWLGVPMWVGPLLAAALVVVSVELARSVARSGPSSWQEHELWLTRFVALASLCCVALRYHTADTMAHGLAALCLAGALLCAVRAASHDASAGSSARWCLLGGLAAGWLFATRPVSCLALAAGLFALAAAPGMRGLLAPRRLALFFVGAQPGLWLWLAYQHHATGSFFASAQGAYYALSDGPPGCFHYGFGANVGCLGEHGDFVRHNLPHGYGALEALATSGRRIKLHLEDALNVAPLAPLIAVGAWRGRRQPLARALAVIVCGQVLAYAPFYFDGNYPGGGARMFADVLPLEHVLAALGVIALAESAPRLRLERLASIVVATALVGFALRTGAQHAMLRDREGGAPMFGADAWRRAGVALEDLAFVDTDHGFNLAAAESGPDVARFHDDDLDRLLWEELGRPRSFRHRYRFDSGSQEVEPIRFDPRPSSQLALSIEGESLWPPLDQQQGWVWPSHFSHACVHAQRALELRPSGAGSMTVRLRLPAALAGRELRIRLWEPTPTTEESPLILNIYADGVAQDGHTLAAARSAGCRQLPPLWLPSGASRLELRIASGRRVAIDQLYAEPPRAREIR